MAISKAVRAMKFFLGLAVILVFTLSAKVIPAETRITEQTQYYSIQGLTSNDLYTEMRQHGPDGFSANTSWKIRDHYKTRVDGSGCAIPPVTVSVNITYTMPEWVNKSQASPALQKRWDQYLNRLTVHENGHRDIAVKNAHLIDQKLFGLKASSCGALEDRSKRIADEIFDKTKNENAEYDRVTQHGRTQSAYFK
ncbi:MAG: DUF922 domain-containing Zn-dependent protease [Deltaproteobacteria bacterium]|nr:DUF922 domain-containing Zn-dependent protease [Deltaproteobacteria bacterium]